MSLRTLILATLCGLAMLAVTPSQAALLVNEAFSHSDGDLHEQIPAPGPGGAWTQFGNSTSIPIQVTGNAAILNSGGGNGGREDLFTGVPAQSATATTYAAFDLNLPSSANSDIVNVDDNGLYFAAFYHGSSNSFRGRVGVIGPASGGDYILGVNANGQSVGGGALWPAELSFDTTYRVVVSYDAASGDSEMWVNPTDSSSASVFHDSDSTGDQIIGFALRQSTDYEGQQIIDNLCVATFFDQALHCIVPEPAGLLIALVAMLALTFAQPNRETR